MGLPTPQDRRGPQFILDDLELGHRATCSLGCEQRGFGAWINPKNFELPPWMIKRYPYKSSGSSFGPKTQNRQIHPDLQPYTGGRVA